MTEYSCYHCGTDLPETHQVRFTQDGDMPICSACLRNTVSVVTNPCVICDQRTSVTVSKDGFNAWQNGTFVQDAFPELPVGTRELLISGTHPQCWKDLGFDEEF